MRLNFLKALQSYMDIIQKGCYITCIMLNRLHKTHIKLDFFHSTWRTCSLRAHFCFTWQGNGICDTLSYKKYVN